MKTGVLCKLTGGANGEVILSSGNVIDGSIKQTIPWSKLTVHQVIGEFISSLDIHNNYNMEDKLLITGTCVDVNIATDCTVCLSFYKQVDKISNY